MEEGVASEFRQCVSCIFERWTALRVMSMCFDNIHIFMWLCRRDIYAVCSNRTGQHRTTPDPSRFSAANRIFAADILPYTILRRKTAVRSAAQ